MTLAKSHGRRVAYARSTAKTLMVRLPEDLVERIDAERGDVPRERWVRRRLEELLDTLAVERST